MPIIDLRTTAQREGINPVTQYLTQYLQEQSDRKRKEDAILAQNLAAKMQGFTPEQQQQYMASQDPRTRGLYEHFYGATTPVDLSPEQQLARKKVEYYQRYMNGLDQNSAAGQVIGAEGVLGRNPNAQFTDALFDKEALGAEGYQHGIQTKYGLRESANNAADNTAAMQQVQAKLAAEAALRAAQEEAARAQAQADRARGGYYGAQTDSERMEQQGTLPARPTNPRDHKVDTSVLNVYDDRIKQLNAAILENQQKLTMTGGDGARPDKAAMGTLIKRQQEAVRALTAERDQVAQRLGVSSFSQPGTGVVNGGHQQAAAPVGRSSAPVAQPRQPATAPVGRSSAPAGQFSPDVEQKINTALQTINPDTGKPFTRNEIVAYMRSKGIIH